jgi:hypothetical protein
MNLILTRRLSECPAGPLFPVFPLAFFAFWWKMQVRSEFRVAFADQINMNSRWTNYFWFYFSAPGRGTGGGL